MSSVSGVVVLQDVKPIANSSGFEDKAADLEQIAAIQDSLLKEQQPVDAIISKIVSNPPNGSIVKGNRTVISIQEVVLNGTVLQCRLDMFSSHPVIKLRPCLYEVDTSL